MILIVTSPRFIQTLYDDNNRGPVILTHSDADTDVTLMYTFNGRNSTCSGNADSTSCSIMSCRGLEIFAHTNHIILTKLCW